VQACDTEVAGRHESEDEALFTAIAEVLDFPDYFGGNPDAGCWKKPLSCELCRSAVA
jgi:Barstar (barnase inhibitor)